MRDISLDNWYDNVLLPKLWTEVIRRWWDEKVPTDYPTDTGVEFTLDFGENKDAVTAMEATLDTDNPIVAPYVEENTYVGEYVGTFEAEGEGGEQVLLSPKKINADKAIALHYNADSDSWENVENVNVVDGYVYGDLESLSPIAVFTVRDDIELVENLEGLNIVAGKGHPVKVYTEDEKIYATNLDSGTKIDITSISPIFIVGGTYDGSDVKETSVCVDGVTHEKLRVYCGSVGKDDKVPNVGLAKAYVVNSKIEAVSGSYYKARTDKVDIVVKDSEIINHIGGGQSMYHGTKNKDGNQYPQLCPLDNSADWVTNEVNITLDNVKTLIFYTAGASGLTYTKKAVANITNCEIEYCCNDPSNGLVDDTTLNATDCKVNIAQNTNRGNVKSATMTLTGCTAETGFFVAGDSTDSTVTGTLEEVRVTIEKGCSGTLFLGTNGGEELKDNAIVKYVKYSRSADIDISDNVKEVLGEKLKVK